MTVAQEVYDDTLRELNLAKLKIARLMKRVCVEGKTGESVCAKGQWPIGSVENATCWECLRLCVKSERDFQEVQERVMADDRKEIDRLREAITRWVDRHHATVLADRPGCNCELCRIAREGR